MNKALIAVAGCLLLAACGTQPVTLSSGHIMDEPSPPGSIPKPVQLSAQLPPPKAAPKVETYSVVVNKVPVQELLFALARDAKLNVDINPGIEGSVTLNALDQTLQQLLTRIAKQVDMRYELNGPNLAVMPDTPFLRNYKVDYVDISRDTTSNVNIATQIATAGGTGTTGTTGTTGGNNSTTSVTNTSKNHFWLTLVQNIKDILRETDKILPEGSSETTTEQSGSQTTTGTGAPPVAGKNGKTAATLASSPNPAALTSSGTTTVRRTTFHEAASVIFNSEAGLIAVRATNRQHEKIQAFLDQVLNSAKRQVLIEATIAEVQLNDQYQQGINWQRLRNGATGFSLSQTSPVTPSPTATGAGLLVLGYANPASAIGNIAATLQFLESFGKVKVLSSPKISVLNNQTALLKVVDNNVYFTITATTTAGTGGSAAISTYTSELHTVPVGFVMSVTPQIADSDEITLNVRPTISRIVGYVQDPNPALSLANPPVVSNIPIIQAREMESILKVTSGQTAVMGGLMQDSINNQTDEIPGIGKAPLIGNLFNQRNNKTAKTELVIFLRPVVIKDASIDGDYKAYRSFLPDENYLKDPNRRMPESAKEDAARP